MSLGHACRVCGEQLTRGNMSPSQIERCNWICRRCSSRYYAERRRNQKKPKRYVLKITKMLKVQPLENVGEMVKVSYVTVRESREATTWLTETMFRGLTT